MRALAISILLLFTAASARAGDCPDCPPPSLSDREQRPTVKAAIAATKTLFTALRKKDHAKVGAAIAIPFLYDLSGRGLQDQGCHDGAAYVDEAEGMPGRPACLVTVLAKQAKKLAGQITKKNVFGGLAALEKKKGKLRAPARAELELLINHRLVYLKKGAWTVVVAVRSDGGDAVVDAVIVEPPKGYGKKRTTTADTGDPATRPPPQTSLSASDIKAGIDTFRAKALAVCGDRFPSASGTVKLKVRVTPSGAVDQIAVQETPDEGLAECVHGYMAKATFAATDVGGSFTYPFDF